MHYYTHHLGDYAKDTGHLSLLEHGAYRVLLDWAYASERGLPESEEDIFRICRARSTKEEEAVRRVVLEFFSAEDRKNPRAGREIAAFRGLSEKNQKKAHLSWEKRRSASATAYAPADAAAHATADAGADAGAMPPNNHKPLPINHPPKPSGEEEGNWIPADAEVMAFGAAFAGEPASGTPGPIAAAFLADWLRQMHGRREFPPRWKRALVAAWRGDASRYMQPVAEGKKNAAAGQTPAQVRYHLDKEKERLEAEVRAGNSLGTDYREALAKLERVEGEIASTART